MAIDSRSVGHIKSCYSCVVRVYKILHRRPLCAKRCTLTTARLRPLRSALDVALTRVHPQISHDEPRSLDQGRARPSRSLCPRPRSVVVASSSSSPSIAHRPPHSRTHRCLQSVARDSPRRAPLEPQRVSRVLARSACLRAASPSSRARQARGRARARAHSRSRRWLSSFGFSSRSLAACRRL